MDFLHDLNQSLLHLHTGFRFGVGDEHVLLFDERQLLFGFLFLDDFLNRQDYVGVLSLVMDDCHLFLQDLLILDSSEVHHVFGLLSVLCDGNFGWFALLDLGDFADNIRNDVSRGCILDSTLDIGSNGNDMVGDSLDSLGLHFFGFCKQTLFDHVVLTSRGAAHEESVNVLVDIKHQGSTQEISDLADLLGNWLKTTVTAVLGNDTGNRGLHVKSRSRRSCF